MPFSLTQDLQAMLATWQVLMQHPLFWREVGVLFLAAAGALAVRHKVGLSLAARGEASGGDSLRGVALKSLQRIIFPLGMLLGVLLARSLLLYWGNPVDLLNVAIALLLSLVSIRVAVYVLRKTFRPGPVVKAWENLIATSLWIVVALHLLGWLPAVLKALDAMDLEVGKTRISLLETGKLILTLALLWLLALWLARIIEGRIARSTYLGRGMQVALAKLARFVLLVLACLLALNAVGIDLTVLAVFGGALGVGLGFGLQRIASNFISGFIILFDRSIRPGDVITIDNTLGWVQELHARYVVVRSRDGVDRLIPNEHLITNPVINWSYTDTNVRVKVPVSISYDDDPEQAMTLLLQAARASPRVLDTPAPTARFLAFGDSDIKLELRVWIDDPEAGLAGVRSDINLAIWRLFKEAGITIPYPQRDLHIRQHASGMPADIGDN